MKNLLIPGVKVKASSGTSKDAKSMLDDSLETCWSGEAPSASKATLTFTLPKDEDQDVSAPKTAIQQLKRIGLTFQGGYSVQKVTLIVKVEETWEKIGEVFPRDGNERQEFDVPSLPGTIPASSRFSALRLELEGSTDDFGRVIVYRVALWASSE